MIDMPRDSSRAGRALSKKQGAGSGEERGHMSNTTIPCVSNGRASLLVPATVSATTLAGIIAAHTHANTLSLAHTHTLSLLYTLTTKEIAHFQRFEFVKGYFSHYNKK